ncbi:MAG: J domain-containing protein [bacterium]|nr:J domain-containing protein [bacterium]
MATIKVRNYELPAFDMKQASSRKALQLKNTIISNLKKLGVHEDFITVKEEAVVIKRAPASVSWYMDGQNLYYSYTSHNYIQNLYVVSSIIDLEIQAVLSGEKTREECVNGFYEDKGVEGKRKEARELLGVSKDCYDFDLISKKYKDLSKTHHPDMGGDLEMFQEINNAHKMLKRELC